MIFPGSWVMLKKKPEAIEILQNEKSDVGIVTSFVCENKRGFINIVEETIDIIIKTNIEREEKERLFKNKVQELKNIFEKENLENLKALKFDLEELTKLTNNEPEVTIKGSTETVTKN
jgi:nicotinic acid phosphoribosyltransferase